MHAFPLSFSQIFISIGIPRHFKHAHDDTEDTCSLFIGILLQIFYKVLNTIEIEKDNLKKSEKKIV